MSGRYSWTWFNGEWREGNTPILGAADHGAWLGSMIFDGARAFDGMTPDLDRHCARANESARRMGLEPTHSDEELHRIALEGVSKFSPGAHLYIRPMIWATIGTGSMITPDREALSPRFASRKSRWRSRKAPISAAPPSAARHRIACRWM